MNFIILDLEWNQAPSGAKMIRTPVVLHGEIIQIGAVKTDENFNMIDKIKINVRPKFYKKMNPYVEKITGITSVSLTCGETFPQAFARFAEWCGEEFRFITWGFDDLGVFSDNLVLHGLDPDFGKNYINLQLIYNKQVNSEHKQIALSTAAEKLEIPIDVQVHDALNDAYLTYEVCRKLNMVQGLAEYGELVHGIAVPIAKDVIDYVKDGKKILADSRVTDVRCPKCGEKMTLREWLWSSARTCKNLAQCREHGDFPVKLKASRISDDRFTVIRSVYEGTPEGIAEYEAKLKRKLEKKSRSKQNNGNEAENSDNPNGVSDG